MQPRFEVRELVGRNPETRIVASLSRAEKLRDEWVSERRRRVSSISITPLDAPPVTPAAVKTAKHKSGYDLIIAGRKPVHFTSWRALRARVAYIPARQYTIRNYRFEQMQKRVKARVGQAPEPDSWFIADDAKSYAKTARGRRITLKDAPRRRSGMYIEAIVKGCVPEPDKRPARGERVLSYMTSDGQDVYRFFFKDNSRYRGYWQVYIVDHPPYPAGRRSDDVATHRLRTDEAGATYHLCWMGRLTTETEARSVAEEWANRTQNYRQHGTFQKPNPGGPLTLLGAAAVGLKAS